MINSIIVIAKEPVPGRVKTRLVPPLSYAQAAEVAASALLDTLRAAADVSAGAHVLALEGVPGSWLPGGWRVVAQSEGGLDLRLTAAFNSVAAGPALLVGMDTPQIRADQLAVFDPSNYDACLGPAADGGYWAIGFRDRTRAAQVIPGVPMSAGNTCTEQLRRMRAAGMRVQMLDEMVDVDTIDTAVEVARLVPGSAFSRALADAMSRVCIPIGRS